MKKEVTIYICDVCREEIDTELAKEKRRNIGVFLPVVFTTEQSEGRSVEHYLEQSKLHLCDECYTEMFRLLPISASGAQGANTYRLRR